MAHFRIPDHHGRKHRHESQGSHGRKEDYDRMIIQSRARGGLWIRVLRIAMIADGSALMMG